jgi:putative oxidoreductase
VVAGAPARLVALQIAGALAGLLLVGGLWTPAVGAVATLLEVWLAFTESGNQPLTIILATLAISLAMIGPGAWSIDARLYGRKQILPPEP